LKKFENLFANGLLERLRRRWETDIKEKQVVRMGGGWNWLKFV
jgi:hypothetical protein